MSRNIKFRPSAAEKLRQVQAALNVYSSAPVDIGAKPKRAARPVVRKKPKQERLF